VRTKRKQSRKKPAFTIVELLTVMSVIIVLISMLIPALNQVKKVAKKVKQKAQFHSIEVALEVFDNEWDGLPDSDGKDDNLDSYCGAMKLCEAMIGQDLLGFHPDSLFNSDCKDAFGNDLYIVDPATGTSLPQANIKARRKPYLQLRNANGYRLSNIYGPGKTNPFEQNRMVLCDVYGRTRLEAAYADDPLQGLKVGMPILYYKANLSKTTHDVKNPDNENNIYDYKDNDELVKLPAPWSKGITVNHPMSSSSSTTNGNPGSALFYANTRNRDISIKAGRPYRADTYILISAGFDGKYGTRDDVFNYPEHPINLEELDGYIKKLPQ